MSGWPSAESVLLLWTWMRVRCKISNLIRKNVCVKASVWHRPPYDPACQMWLHYLHGLDTTVDHTVCVVGLFRIYDNLCECKTRGILYVHSHIHRFSFYPVGLERENLKRAVWYKTFESLLQLTHPSMYSLYLLIPIQAHSTSRYTNWQEMKNNLTTHYGPCMCVFLHSYDPGE